MINFISNLPQDLRSGGFSAMNSAAFAALGKQYPLHLAGPINPRPDLLAKAVSKLRRIAGTHGDFFFFSQQRLRTIAREVRARCMLDAELDFFHGFTPWILSEPVRPYIAWSDCTFRDYIGIYHHRDEFREEDLRRIERAEADWLRRARRVLFTSDWAAARAVSDYALDAGRVSSVGIFGETGMPARDQYAGGKSFAFVSTNFEAKGGHVALAAHREVRARHPESTLMVVGDRPAAPVAQPGVEFTGFLHKEDAAEAQRLDDILGRARALVCPTRSDIAPLIIVEAGYFGCPVISSRRFAIPELVDDGRSGLLLEELSNPETLAAAMQRMLEDEAAYRKMRAAAWEKAREEYSKVRFERRLLSCVDAVHAELLARSA